MRKFLEKYPVFLLLLPLFVVLHIEKENHGVIIYKFIYDDIIFLFLTPVVCYGIAWPLMRSVRKAAITTALLLMLFYFFGEMKEMVKWFFPGTIWQSYTLLFPLSIVLLIAGIIFVKRSKSKFFKAYLFLNTLLLLFIVADLASILFFDNKNEKNHQLPVLTNNCSDCVKPDIYYLVFDSYSSSSFLKNHFNYDNSAIDSALTAKGFRIIPGSKSNYNLTPFSISSEFRFDYLHGLDTAKGFTMQRYLPAILKVYHSPLMPMMDQLGYKIYNHSIFHFNTYPSTVPAFDMWQMRLLYQRYNLVKKIDRDIGWNFAGWPHLVNRNTLYTYATNRDRHDSITLAHLYQTIAAQEAKPKFVYGHILVPHSPYTWDSVGKPVAPIPLMSPGEDIQAYLSQIGYVNKIMSKLVNQIFESQKKPFIIIIQGDHGYRFFNEEKNTLEFNNFNAMYFYNRDYRLLHDSLTNINTFPIIFNTFLGQQLPMREDHLYFLKYK